jgi:hypothetical protein
MHSDGRLVIGGGVETSSTTLATAQNAAENYPQSHRKAKGIRLPEH